MKTVSDGMFHPSDWQKKKKKGRSLTVSNMDNDGRMGSHHICVWGREYRERAEGAV